MPYTLRMEVTLQSNGKYWVARWVDSRGVEHRSGLGSKANVREAEARRRVTAMNVEFAGNPGRRDAGKTVRLSEWRRIYFAQRSDLGETTEALHRVAMERLAEFLPSDPRLSQITRQTAAEFRAWIRARKYRRGDPKRATERTLSAATVRRYVATLKQIMGRAKAQDLIAVNPFDREVIGAPPSQEGWTYIDLKTTEKIIEACPRESWRLAFALARFAGLRMNEIQRAEWGWVDWHERTINVRRKGEQDTTKSRARVVPIQPALYTFLCDAFERREDGDRFICNELEESLSHAARKLVVAAGVPAYSKPFHTLRKSLESDWLARFPLPDVCAWLGHSPEVALRHYHKTKRDTIAMVTERPAQNPQLDPQINTPERI